MARLLATLGLVFLALLWGGGVPAQAAQETLPAALSYSTHYRAGPVENPARFERSAVVDAIHEASQRTGMSYDYLVAQAQIESGLNPTARARGSSAAGLFQFVDRTWLASVRKHARRFGLEAAINSAQASDEAILAARDDPRVAALLAAAYAEENAAVLHKTLGRIPTHAELYLAHFLGPIGAVLFLTRWQQNPDATAADLFPDAARANRSVFFTREGEARSLAAVRALFEQKLISALADVGGLPRASSTFQRVKDNNSFLQIGISATSRGSDTLQDDQAVENNSMLLAGRIASLAEKSTASGSTVGSRTPNSSAARPATEVQPQKQFQLYFRSIVQSSVAPPETRVGRPASDLAVTTDGAANSLVTAVSSVESPPTLATNVSLRLHAAAHHSAPAIDAGDG
ncbi:MAG: transglycosylase SLT domain-containing protein [Sphingomonadaceae bacterium]|nr:transglycosylase SLT domain-containing protein [Sphingomonadaceae bacterium]